jgi:hypothetical protein
MSADLEQLDGKLAELRAQRDALAAVKTKEDRREEVESWLEAMRARYAGSARFVLGGHGSPEQVEAVLAEDKFVDAGLAGRLVARLEADGFGDLSNRQRDTQRKKLDAAIVTAEAAAREAAKAAAIAAVERQYAREAA